MKYLSIYLLNTIDWSLDVSTVLFYSFSTGLFKLFLNRFNLIFLFYPNYLLAECKLSKTNDFVNYMSIAKLGQVIVWICNTVCKVNNLLNVKSNAIPYLGTGIYFY